MEHAGRLPEEAPDPRIEREEMLKRMPIPVLVFAPQPAVGHADIGVGTGTDAAGLQTMTASVTSTLWRNPDDKDDPVNLADLDDATRRSIDEVPPWPRPRWLIEQVERMRYRTLWEAVQTTWYREASEFTTLGYLLVQHANHILMNQFREEHAVGLHDWGSPALTSERVIRRGVDVVIDGEIVVGAEIDTDPFVYAIGAELANGGVFTAVIPREDLPYLDLAFATRAG
ncbi:hypothetical protein ACFC3F_14650 [Microbacterium sp. NPDC055910]|uniref:hypothetical protein n=1 Tax=Microbacterium sp. NPDC055910 TaxID=3345659 RepID=UPI0035D92AE3